MKLQALFMLLIVTIEGSNLCGTKNASCSDQLWTNASSTTCSMTYYKPNSAECASWTFHYKTDNHKLGNVQLFTFVNDNYRQTLFNVTFSSILWKRVLMRFASLEQESEKNACRRFEVWENTTVPGSSVLNYDCAWTSSDYEGRDFMLEYELSSQLDTEYGKIFFRVPSYNFFHKNADIKTLQLFTYVDVTDSEYLELHIQTAPRRYNITKYLVEVIRERSNMSLRLTEKILDVQEAIIINGHIVFLYPTWNEFGYFYFMVSPCITAACQEDECLKSYTPKYLVGRKKSSLVIGIVGASVILFALFYAMFFWNKKKNGDVEKVPPRVLLVYNPSIEAHCDVVGNLAQFLQDLLNIEILLDVVDIPRTNHKDPLQWCNHAFNYATHIIYIASPKKATEDSDNIYRIYEATLKFIKKELCEKSTKQLLVVTFPYSVNNVPLELSNLSRYDLPKDMDSLVNNLVTLPYQSWIFWHLYRPNRYSDHPQYNNLLASIRVAQQEIDMMPESPSSCNQTPKITVTKSAGKSSVHNSIELEDEKKPLHQERTFNTRLSDLNMSGDVENDVETTPVRFSDVKINM